MTEMAMKAGAASTGTALRRAFAGDYVEVALGEHEEIASELLPLLVSWSRTQEDRRLGGQFITYFPLEHSWHSADDLHERAPFRRLTEIVEGLAADHFEPHLRVFSMWSIVSRRSSRGERHDHRGRVSGVYYLHSGHAEGEAITGAINFHCPGGLRSVAPRGGRLLLFPATLEHDVDAYLGEGERVVVAFNLM